MFLPTVSFQLSGPMAHCACYGSRWLSGVAHAGDSVSCTPDRSTLAPLQICFTSTIAKIPILYTRCATGVLRDITVGNNGAYAAAVGWDACTGLGSPNGAKLLQALSA